MICLGAKYLTAAGFGRYRITAASLGSLDLLGTLGWLMPATKQAIMDAFGVDGPAVIAATNEYLNGIAASDKAKATALAANFNVWIPLYVPEDKDIMYSFVPTLGKLRYLQGISGAWINTGYVVKDTDTLHIISDKGGWIAGCRNGGYSNSIHLNYLSGANHRVVFGSHTDSASPYNSASVNATWLDTYMAKNSLIMNGEVGQIAAYVGLPNIAFPLFALKTDNSVTLTSTGKIAQADIDGAFYLVPFIRNNVKGMLDLLTGTFKDSETSTKFQSIAMVDSPWTPPTP